MCIQLAIHQQYVVAELLGSLDLAVLGLGVGGVEINDLLVLVGLLGLDAFAVILEAEELTVGVLKQGEVHSAFAEFLIGEHSVFDEELEVVPLLLELLALLLEDLFQPVGHLLGDVGAYLLHVGIALQVAAADVQGDVRRIDHAVQEGEEVGDYVIHVVGDEHLVAVELDLVLVDGHTLLDLGEVQHAGEVEGIIYVQMNPEHRFLVEGIEGFVEVLVVLVLQVRRGLGPYGFDVVDDIVFVGLDLLAILPLGLLAEDDRDRHELAVLAQKLGNAAFLGELGAVVVEVEGDDGTAVFLLAVFHIILGRAVAGPFDGLGAFLPGEGVDGDLLADHECGVESESEVADYALVLVFLEEFAGRREGYLVDVFIYLLGGHTYAVVDYAEYLFLLVELDFDLELA